MDSHPNFKTCSCGTKWASPQSLIRDSEIDPIGMTITDLKDVSRAYYFFNHLKCQSTLAINVEDFSNLVEETIPPQVKAGEEGCTGHCIRIEDLDACDNECHNAPFRRLLIERILKKDV